MIITYDKTDEQMYEEITELAKLIYGTRVGCVNISDVFNEASKAFNRCQRNEEWGGVEPLFVGAIVRLGVVEAVTGAEACIRHDDNELIVHNISDIQPVKDEADKIVTLYDGSESDSLAGQLRDLKSLGLIEFTL